MAATPASAPGALPGRLEHPWALGADEVPQALHSDVRRGLTEGEAARRLEVYGPNELREQQPRSLLRILWDQLASPVVALLIAAMIAALAFQEWIDAIAVAVVLLLNTAIGFFTELRARRSMESLRAMGQVEARVVREGQTRDLPADALVPGDVVLLEGGDVVTADMRLVEVDALQIDESALTGESVPVDKQAERADADAVLAERSSMAFKGTAVTGGSARAVVVATGMETELGRISEMVASAETVSTPLQDQLLSLAHRLVWLTVAVVVVVGGLGVFAERDLLEMINVAIALAVAAIPEGLPVVATIALARGMHRMVARNALMRQLAAVHTLGATTVICTDKTGTLTENQMHVRRVRLACGMVEVADDGALALDDPDAEGLLRQAIEVGALCNTAARCDDGGEPPRRKRRNGDPMEQALLELAARLDLDRDALLKERPRARLVPFERASKMMASYHDHASGVLIAVKGAPEAVLAACTHVRRTADGDEVALDDTLRAEWHAANEAMAAEGMRILGLAFKEASSQDAEPYEGLRLLGLVGLIDPPRATVPQAIRACRDAGIRVIMVTGDQPATAQAIARDVGLLTEAEESSALVLRGCELASRPGNLTHAAVLARVDPAQKLKLIERLQAERQVVAMTGDGVNDAPALKKADIGIAMGERGTEVARDAADVVLLDDAFDTIVAAIHQGRVIFDNIRKFVVYLLSGNVGQLLAVGTTALTAAPLPLTALQILYLNMVNDVFPALALGVGPGGNDVLERPPQDPDEPILSRRQWTEIFVYGLVIAATLLGVFFAAIGVFAMSYAQAVTVSFLTISFGRLWHALNMRTVDSHVMRNEITRNRWFWGSIALCLALLMAAVYAPPLAGVLGLEPPSSMGWLLIAVGSAVPLCLGQTWLVLRRHRRGVRRHDCGSVSHS